MLGLPPWGRHRLAGGLYTTIGEKVAGVALANEWADAGPRGSAIRIGVTLGADLDHLLRTEGMTFVGLVW
jgi:hypothetical protein